MACSVHCSPLGMCGIPLSEALVYCHALCNMWVALIALKMNIFNVHPVHRSLAGLVQKVFLSALIVAVRPGLGSTKGIYSLAHSLFTAGWQAPGVDWLSQVLPSTKRSAVSNSDSLSRHHWKACKVKIKVYMYADTWLVFLYLIWVLSWMPHI